MRKPLILLALLLLVTGCGSKPAAKPGPAVAVLVDVSGSATAIRDRYIADFERVLAAMKGGERLYTFTIQANSAVAPVASDIAFETSHGNDYTQTITLKRQAQEATKQFVDALNASETARRGSAIIDGLRHAAGALAKLPPEQERVVVVLSDMIEQSELSDFTALNQDGVTALVERLTTEGWMPSLKGARVYVAGISDGSGSLPASQVQAIRSFWEQFFEAAGATLEWYGPSLTNFQIRV